MDNGRKYMMQPRAIDFDSGIAMVVTDLHGSGSVYDHIRMMFLSQLERGLVDRLIICGDLIHGYGREDADYSLGMILDVMKLQEELGKDTVVMLMGNHEMPHIYDVPLSKGNIEFTSRFERALSHSGKREEVVAFLKSLPFYARTKAGVLISHAGATPSVMDVESAERVLTFDHDALLILAEQRVMNGYDLESLKSDRDYLEQSMYYLAIDGPNDPRFHRLLRGHMISHADSNYNFLWDVLFATNEQGITVNNYNVVAKAFSEAISQLSAYPQSIIVAGHIGVRGGHQIVGDRHLRLATYSHATPREMGQYLLLDCGRPVRLIADLIDNLRPTFP